ncbi:MAG TPA: bifunctional riboflavin kinase/FAD synthetase [Bacteroidota bacterium]
MKLVNQLSEITHDRNSVVTVGTFDGMHLAHQELLREVVQRAKRRNGRAVVVTFEPHPREVVGNHKGVPILTTLREKQEIAAALGVDLFFTIAFDYAFSRLTAREFYLEYLVKGIGVSEIVEGYDHHFGRDREGSIEEMLRLGKEFGYSSVAVQEFVVHSQVVSSTAIRDLLVNGDVEGAAQLLGRPYSLNGSVVKGDMRGRTLGFPTANLQLESEKKLVPKNGIYFVEVGISEKKLAGIASIGVRPTFATDGRRVIEVYILDFQNDIYGTNLRIALRKRLRDEIRFSSTEELINQMRLDKTESIRLRNEYLNLKQN